ncbi:GAK system ATP-grasp enzyme [Algibacillus agarilyticus]|uniref:GAK system ATP-grasp enzyme n=1 Tax=Algibacillus agarilyticus TaxID=2234133 RepID=UPI000DCFF47E|nr:GAK system ATP-grasp enzyme [Algibacillus agarilyticus]
MTNLKIGVIGIPGKWSTETLADSIETATGFRCVIDMAKVSLDLTNHALIFNGINLSEFDALIVKKISAEYSPNTLDRLELLRMAEAQGVRVFSGAESMLRLINRVSCTVTLRNNGIPMPDTVITEDVEHAITVVKQFGAAVFKPLFSTKARGMCLIESDLPDDEIKARVSEFKAANQSMYIQRKIDLSGQDLGMVFLAGKYLGTYARVSQNDSWNTTINSGGKYEPFEPSQDIIDLAYKAQAPFNMDFTTVDVALTPDGPIVFEVSAFGGFKGALEGAGVNAAKLYVDHVLTQLKSKK